MHTLARVPLRPQPQSSQHRGRLGLAMQALRQATSLGSGCQALRALHVSHGDGSHLHVQAPLAVAIAWCEIAEALPGAVSKAEEDTDCMQNFLAYQQILSGPGSVEDILAACFRTAHSRLAGTTVQVDFFTLRELCSIGGRPKTLVCGSIQTNTCN